MNGTLWARRKRGKQRIVFVLGNILRCQQGFTIEDRIRSGDHAKDLRLAVEFRAAGRKPDARGREHDPRGSDHPHEIDSVDSFSLLERRALDRNQRIDRHAFGMRIERSQGLQHGGAVAHGLSPMPMMPPQHIAMPGARTACKVSSRSS